MPLLEELSRRLRAQLPQLMGGYQAQSRLSHAPITIAPNDQWGTVQADNNTANTYGFTTDSPLLGPHIFIPRRETTDANLSNAPILRHEALHTFLDRNTSQMPGSRIADMIGEDGMKALYGRGYNWTQALREGPARFTTQPDTLMMSEGSGQDAMRKYLDLLRRQDPSKAARLAKYLGLVGSEKGDGAAELQRPNDTF